MKVKIDGLEVECTLAEFIAWRQSEGKASAKAVEVVKSEPPVKAAVVERVAPVANGGERKQRGVKSLVVATIGRYGAKGLTVPQIATLSGLSVEQVKGGIWSAMKQKGYPVLVRFEEPNLYYTTAEGDSYAIASDFGKKKLIETREYQGDVPSGV